MTRKVYECYKCKVRSILPDGVEDSCDDCPCNKLTHGRMKVNKKECHTYSVEKFICPSCKDNNFTYCIKRNK